MCVLISLGPMKNSFMFSPIYPMNQSINIYSKGVMRDIKI